MSQYHRHTWTSESFRHHSATPHPNQPHLRSLRGHLHRPGPAPLFWQHKTGCGHRCVQRTASSAWLLSNAEPRQGAAVKPAQPQWQFTETDIFSPEQRQRCWSRSRGEDTRETFQHCGNRGKDRSYPGTRLLFFFWWGVWLVIKSFTV